MNVVYLFVVVVFLCCLRRPALAERCSVEGDIRLPPMWSSSSSEGWLDSSSVWVGRVEVCLGGVWGTVCDDSWRNPQNTKVICNQIGRQMGVTIANYTYYGNRFSRSGSPSRNSIPIHLTDVACTGLESSLLDCSYRPGQRACSHYEDVGVACIPSNSDSPIFNCSHEEYQFQCKGGLCIRLDQVCDISQDCQSGEDESSPPCPPLSCRRDQFRCLDGGLCVDSSNLCDGYRNCADGSDEEANDCVSRKQQSIQEARERSSGHLGLTVGLSTGVVMVAVLLWLSVFGVCMLVPQCPLRNLYSQKVAAVAPGGRGEARGIGGERGGGEDDNEEDEDDQTPISPPLPSS